MVEDDSLQRRFRRAVRARMRTHALMIFVAWPVLSVLGGTAAFMEGALSNFVGIESLGLVYGGTLVGALRLAPEFVVVGLMAFALSLGGFSLAAAIGHEASEERRTSELLLEPVLLLLAILLGVSFEYPAVLRHPFLRPLRPLTVPVAWSVATLFVVALSFALCRRLNRTARVVAFLLLVGVASWALTFAPRLRGHRSAGSDSIVLLGIDTLAQTEDVSALRASVARRGGVWYERPVTPGLLTNTVWSAILMARPVSSTNVYFIRQAPDWSRAPFNLVRAARESGFTTVSFFANQLTCFVGSDAGYDIDRSGPKGWLQLATAETKNASVLLPLIVPLLPRLPLATVPPNQAGTYSWDVERELNDALTAGGIERRAFVGAHNDYLHQQRFPGFSELTSRERRTIRSLRVGDLADAGIGWEDVEHAETNFPLSAWKRERLQRLIAAAIDRSGILDPSRRNRLVIFSDHGYRGGLNKTNFCEPRFHHVVLATFGTEKRDAAKPISLIDVAALLDLAPDSAAPAAVEFASVPHEMLVRLGKSAKLSITGDIEFDPRLLVEVAGSVHRCVPYAPLPKSE